MPQFLELPSHWDDACCETEYSDESSKRRFAQCDRSSALAGFGLELDPAVPEVEFLSVADAVYMYFLHIFTVTY